MYRESHVDEMSHSRGTCSGETVRTAWISPLSRVGLRIVIMTVNHLARHHGHRLGHEKGTYKCGLLNIFIHL